MKVITTNRLNRFWKNGVLPIKNALATKLNTSSVVNNLLTTAAGYTLDARQGKALDDKITALNGKSTQQVTATINGLSCTYNFIKIGQAVYCTISAIGTLATNSGEVSNVIPTAYQPIYSVYITAKNVSGGNDYGTTRYMIGNNGMAGINSSSTEHLERHASGFWFTN